MTPAGSALVTAVGWALVHFLWQGAAIGLATAAALRVLREARPQARYAVACAGLALALALPVTGTVRRMMQAAPGPAAIALRVTPGWTAAPVAVRTAEADARALPARFDFDAAIRPRLPLLVFAWAIGATLLALRLVAGLAWAGRLGRRQTEPAGGVWLSCLARLARRLNVARRVTLRISRAIDSPLAIGWWRPVVLLPASLLTGMAPELLEALLAHELAHIRRHDYAVNLLQSVAEILLFYHPAVWWLSGKIRDEREQVADHLAAAALGEPRCLALALQQLDLFQLALPQPAQAARGGRLMNRILRLARPEPRIAAWRAAIGLFALVGACATGALVLPHSSLSASDATTLVAGAARFSGGQGSELTGTWKLTTRRTGDEPIQIEFRRADQPGSNWGSSFRAADLTGLAFPPPDGPARFELRREAGVIRFEGRFQGGAGSGDFRFAASAEYLAAMKALGFGELAAGKVFDLAILDVTRQFVEELKAAGYRQITLDQVIAARIHGATGAFAKSMADLLGTLPTVDQLVAMRIHEVTADYTKRMQPLVGTRLTVDQLVAMRIHEVTPEYAAAMRDLLGEGLTVDQLVAFRIHGVTPEETKQLADLLGTTPTADQLVAMRIHGVTPQFAGGMRTLLGPRTVDQLVAFRIHGVSPEFVQSVKALGYDAVTADQLVALRIHSIDPDFIRKVQRERREKPTIDELIQRRIHGTS